MRKVTASEAAQWCGGRLYGPDADISREWRSDSREVSPCGAFVALRGAKTDGHLYIVQTIERGAKLILLEESEMDALGLRDKKYSGVTFIAVSDTTEALARIARGYLQAVAPTVIGITGSVGKTTTRELSVAVLKRRYRVHSAIRSFNTIIGCSLTVLSMPAETEVLVLELGTNHFGEIREMVSYFPPEIAVITEVAPAHLEGFGSVEGVLRAKAEICTSKNLKHVVYNADNKLLREYMSARDGDYSLCPVGCSEGASLRAVSAHIVFGDGGAKLLAEYESEKGNISAEAALFGLQHVYNVGCALALGRHLSVPDGDIQSALAGVRATGGRGVCKKSESGVWVIDEAYNANPSSMNAAVDNVSEVARDGERYDMYAVLGGMRELGGSSAIWHAKTLERIGGYREVILLGEEWFDVSINIPANAKRFRTFEEVMDRVNESDMTNGVLLIKGSNSYGLKRLVAVLTEGRA